jgi:hypothetical protein
MGRKTKRIAVIDSEIHFYMVAHLSPLYGGFMMARRISIFGAMIAPLNSLTI